MLKAVLRNIRSCEWPHYYPRRKVTCQSNGNTFLSESAQCRYTFLLFWPSDPLFAENHYTHHTLHIQQGQTLHKIASLCISMKDTNTFEYRYSKTCTVEDGQATHVTGSFRFTCTFHEPFSIDRSSCIANDVQHNSTVINLAYSSTHAC